MSKALQSKVITLTIYSGTAGGVGKSTIAANLAAYLARRLPFPVMLVDLGIGIDVSSMLHGVYLAPGEVGVLQAWLAALGGAPQPPQPAVKPSAKVNGVYVMPPGPITVNELRQAEASYSARDAAVKLYSIIKQQANTYHRSLVIIDTPPGEYINDLALAVSKIALVVVPAFEASRVFEDIMDHVDNFLRRRATFVVVNKEDKPINIDTPFPVYHLPRSYEVKEYSERRHIFIMYRPRTNPGYRWQMALSELAETVARMAQLMMDQLKEIDEIVNRAIYWEDLMDLARELEEEQGR